MIIAVSGFGGSGKTSYCRNLALYLGAPIVSLDSFFKDLNTTDFKNWDIIDFKRLEDEVLIPYLKGKKTITYGVFNCEKNKITTKTSVTFKEDLIIEGVGLFRPELLKYFTEKVWINLSIEDSIKRGKLMDKEEYGLDENPNWDGLWKENDLQCFEKYNPLEIADLLI